MAGVFSRINEAIAYGLVAPDLSLGASKAAAPAANISGTKHHAKAKSKGVVKYRDGQGNTWTCHGRRPQWFEDALAAG